MKIGGLGDVIAQEGCIDFEENLHKDNLRFMAEMFEGVFWEEYERKYGDDAFPFVV
ncbi:MAG TPA: hypothetical protein QGF86_00725 [Nitrospinaceae bacterium]|jgi:hypothetical protein|nr:hypothetical protein [Nitrospinaceae bacterium]